MPDRLQATVFKFAVAKLHDEIDPGGGHMEKLLDDERKPAWMQELAEFQEGAAIGPELDNPLTEFELQEAVEHPDDFEDYEDGNY